MCKVFVVLVTLLLAGCEKSADQIKREEKLDQERLTKVAEENDKIMRDFHLSLGNENSDSTPVGFDKTKMNLYYEKPDRTVTKINFYAATKEILLSSLGVESKWQEVVPIETDKESARATEGLEIEWTGLFPNVIDYTITGDRYYLEHGIRVGSTKAEVKSAYSNGFSRFSFEPMKYGPIEDPHNYYYIEFTNRPGWRGKGLVFHFDDKDILQRYEFRNDVFGEP